MKNTILIISIIALVVILIKLKFNFDYYSSGFYIDKKTNKCFYKQTVGSVNESLNNKLILSVPVMMQNGDTLESVDIKTFKQVNNFYKDDFYVYKITTHPDELTVIAKPIAEIKEEVYYEDSFYYIVNDSIFYDSPSGGACNGFIEKVNKPNTFNVLKIDDHNNDCAVYNQVILYVNGCLVNKSDKKNLGLDVLQKIKYASENRVFQNRILIGE